MVILSVCYLHLYVTTKKKKYKKKKNVKKNISTPTGFELGSKDPKSDALPTTPTSH